MSEQTPDFSQISGRGNRPSATDEATDTSGGQRRTGYYLSSETVNPVSEPQTSHPDRFVNEFPDFLNLDDPEDRGGMAVESTMPPPESTDNNAPTDTSSGGSSTSTGAKVKKKPSAHRLAQNRMHAKRHDERRKLREQDLVGENTNLKSQLFEANETISSLQADIARLRQGGTPKDQE